MKTDNLVIIASCIALAGCMSGKMVGAMSDKQQVTITFDQGMTSDTYSTTIDGEYFEGKASMVDSSTKLTHAFGLSSHNAPGATMTNFTRWGFTTKRRMKAVLIGSRGNSLKCLMTYVDPSGFNLPGGVGECSHSDGRTINLVW